MSRPVRSAASQTADFLAAVMNEMLKDSDESDDYSEDNDNMNQNNRESEEDFPENEVEIATQDPDDTSEDEIAVPMVDSTQQTNNEFLSTDGSQRWSKVPINPNTGRMRLQNVLNQSPGPVSAVVQRSDSVLGTFSCFIATEMLTKIAPYTNEEGQTIFFNLIDIAAYNALVCYVFTNPNYHKGKLSRPRLFLEELAFQLIGKDTHDAPDTSNPPSTSTSNRRKKRRCLDCPRKDDEKTPEVCNKCEKPICKNHTKTFCFGCCDSNWFKNFFAKKHFWIKNYFYIKFRSNFILSVTFWPPKLLIYLWGT